MTNEVFEISFLFVVCLQTIRYLFYQNVLICLFYQFQRSTESIAKVPTIILSVSYKGVKFIDAKSKVRICESHIYTNPTYIGKY